MSLLNFFTKKTINNNNNNNNDSDNQESCKIKEDDRIKGLKIIENIFNDEYHDKLWAEVNKCEWDDKSLLRRTQHYGYKYNYKSRQLKDEDIAPPFPQWANDLIMLLLEKQIINDTPKQLIVNEYKDNQGISAHVDSKIFGNLIFSISLGSKCKMVFKKKIENKSNNTDDNTSNSKDKSKATSTNNTKNKVEYEKIEKELLPNSIVLLQDESRYLWTHEIPKLKKGDHRISLTFRYLLNDKDDEKPKKNKAKKYSPY
ncbi:hypothetical protein DICPUDRAFT_99071 [Dictyostelium purpureum]|uniref:Fe2OG dioxygenase domain-containing protein n=1 Tax=Dictyostelium purpureum TaxID=5786 RepID=F0ZVX9_DICPU|nr:uncharacterized protein DICPUDRAFT_99071 [Dictyostelium purpureum]EGC31900.1 hypothetical protein DICPUDRAFT_99071 [Dictyostelium purpureum]|eukprot:XP_003291570.1 hypothetical protein DICPUDRAFT_99071 [Dictyostelium purpureum]